MSHHLSHITSAISIIETAKKGEPLAHHLKKVFVANKKYGSKDRKTIATLCYQYYRLGNALLKTNIQQKIITAHFLCNHSSSDLLAGLAPQLNENIALPITDKCLLLNINIKDIFILQNQLGIHIDAHAYALSMLAQPKFFVRIRPGFETYFITTLEEANIRFEKISNTCLALPQGTTLQNYCSINKHAVVQDYNSQQVFNFIKENKQHYTTHPQVWDCCAASGGKSILLYDMLSGHVGLHVSDVRANMLNNLRTRFKEAGIKNYQAFTADLMSDVVTTSTKKFDIIVCDAPCTGSGTWARTPEQLNFFEQKNIASFVQMQQKIASTAIKSLKETGLFFYITCSVFKKENEDVVMYLKEIFHLQILQMEYLKGYEMLADTMFVAVLSF